MEELVPVKVRSMMYMRPPEVDVFLILLAHPAVDIATLDRHYLHSIAAELACIAWEGYALVGRGAIILGAYGVNLYTESRAGVPVAYLSQAQISAMGVGGGASDLEQAIQAYESAHEVVVSINRAPRPDVYSVCLHDETVANGCAIESYNGQSRYGFHYRQLHSSSTVFPASQAGTPNEKC
jgi:hypothetical protein